MANQIGTVDAMRYLGWPTHDERGNLTQEAKAVVENLGPYCTESPLLPSKIATAWDEAKAQVRELVLNALAEHDLDMHAFDSIASATEFLESKGWI